jgi:hypothetical protein
MGHVLRDNQILPRIGVAPRHLKGGYPTGMSAGAWAMALDGIDAARGGACGPSLAALRQVTEIGALSLAISFCRLLHQPENRRLNPRRQSVPLCEDLEDVRLQTLCASLYVLPQCPEFNQLSFDGFQIRD